MQTIKHTIVHKEMSLPEEYQYEIPVYLLVENIRTLVINENKDIDTVYLIHGNGQDFLYVYMGNTGKLPTNYTRITIEY